MVSVVSHCCPHAQMLMEVYIKLVLVLIIAALCAQMLMEVYNKLVKCDEAMPVAANEVYFRTWRGRWCFLPAIPLLCGRRGACPGGGRAAAGQPGSSSWRLPARQMADLGTCMRRVARVLWALHVTFQEVLVCPAQSGYAHGAESLWRGAIAFWQHAGRDGQPGQPAQACY